MFDESKLSHVWSSFSLSLSLCVCVCVCGILQKSVPTAAATAPAPPAVSLSVYLTAPGSFWNASRQKVAFLGACA